MQVNKNIFCLSLQKKKQTLRNAFIADTPTVANMIYDLAELIYGRYLFNLYYVNIKGK